MEPFDFVEAQEGMTVAFIAFLIGLVIGATASGLTAYYFWG